ncbi:MAG: hypothetical protein A2V90_06200 [Gammaproteobacteria bacterium RBG_16_57_12]|nr:MAG: hypothetical protein A2V90_06200 [Gammaproteobacteria bacterium RBG_16_57_12]
MVMNAHNENEAPSVPHQEPAGTVISNPFDAIKLELVIILAVGVALLLVQFFFIDGLARQFLVLAVYGLFSAAWLIFRVTKIMRVYARYRSDTEPRHGAE